MVVEDERYLVKVPRGLREVGVLVEPLTIAEKAAEQARFIAQRLPGDLAADVSFRRALVLGAGPVGLLGAMKLRIAGFDTFVYSKGMADSGSARIVAAIGAGFISSDEYAPAQLAEMIGNVSLIYEATGAAKISFDVLSTLGSNGIFIFTGVPGRKAPIEIDAELIMHNLVLHNQVVLGTVNAGRASFEEAVRDLTSFMERFPEAVRALLTARISLAEARDALLSPPAGAIKSVVAVV
jgi:threonine dehydrogenase-like Zn-dependent dehydrogenase